MRPDPDRVLRGVAMTLIGQVAPEVRTAFGQTNVSIAGSLALYLSFEVDRYADRLLVENRAIAELAAAGMAVVAEDGLRERLASAARELETPDIRVSTLLAANDRLRALLIDLHTAVEGTAGDAARALEERIWEELRESTRRRHVELGR